MFYIFLQDWLPTECKNIRVLAVEYESYLNEWGPKCPYGSEKYVE